MSTTTNGRETVKMETVEISMSGKGLRAVAAMAVLAAVVLAGCETAQADGPQDAEGEEFVRVVNVEVREVEPGPFVEEIRLTAAVMANKDVTVSAEESGVIREILAEKGTRVRDGQPLAKIGDEVLRAQVDQARAAAELAAQTWNRRRTLWEEDRVGSEIAYLEAKFAAEQTAANLQALEERLERTTVRAPFDGVLDERLVEVGTMVSAGTPVARIVDLDPVKVVAGVPERYAADVAVGAEAALTFAVMGDEVFRAPVSYVGATVNPSNRTFPIEVVMPNPEGLIKPQMIANMAVMRGALDSVIVVPQDALVRVQSGYVAFVVVDRGDGPVAEARTVEVGPSQRNLVVVQSGIEPGDRLVVQGQKSVADGDRVNVVGGTE